MKITKYKALDSLKRNRKVDDVEYIVNVVRKKITRKLNIIKYFVKIVKNGIAGDVSAADTTVSRDQCLFTRIFHKIKFHCKVSFQHEK